MNADGSRIVAALTTITAGNSTIYFATWSQSTGTYTNFTATSNTSTGRQYWALTMSQDGTKIAYGDYLTGIVYIAYWNGTNYSGETPIYNYNSLIKTSGVTNLAFSLDNKIIYCSTNSGNVTGNYSLFTSYYNSVTQSYGLFYPSTSVGTGGRNGWPMCISPDGATLYLGYYGGTTPTIACSTVQYTATGEWLQIQLAKPAKLTSYGLLCRPNYPYRIPSQFVLLGSNDGAIWYLVDARDENTTDNITRSNLSTGATITTSVPPLGDSTLITYGATTSYASNFYSYYRLVTISIYNQYTGAVNIGELVMRGVYL
jgi:hypothetical protein